MLGANKRIDSLKSVTNINIFEIICLSSEQEVYDLFSKDETLMEDMIENMIKVYIFKRDYISKLQLGRM